MSSIKDQLRELLTDPLVLDPTDRQAEHETNTWWLSCGDRDGPDDLPDVERLLLDVANAWLDRARSLRPTGQATFYTWYDEQAGQLRVSLTSLDPGNLPFGAAVALLGSPRPVLRQLLSDPHPGFVTWSALRPMSPDEAEPLESPPFEVAVWAQTVVW
jgi:hypothetical protein